MLLSDLLSHLETLAPLRHAEPWDNVGLIVGDPASEVSRILLCIDLTPAVLSEAVSLRCEAILAYHPPIFEGLKRFTAGDIAFEAARRGIAVYSPHTALDAAPGGTNDVLAQALALTNIRPLRLPESKSKHCKLVTFIPDDHVEAVATALANAGAGQIGNYTHCSFRSAGVGTFFGQPGSNPKIGQPGQLERLDETRLETLVPLSHLPQVITALRATHPYEEPAFDLNLLAAPPETQGSWGVGGVGRLGDITPATLAQVTSRLKSALNLPHLLVSGDPSTPIASIALCAGAGRSLIPDVIKSRAQLYLTGELPHHDALKLARHNIASICTLHSNSERPVLTHLAKSLTPTGLTCLLSQRDRDPFTVV